MRIKNDAPEERPYNFPRHHRYLAMMDNPLFAETWLVQAPWQRGFLKLLSCEVAIMFEKMGDDALAIIPCCASKAGGGISIGQYRDPLAELVSKNCLERVFESRAHALHGVKASHNLMAGSHAKNVGIDAGPDFGGHGAAGQYLPALHRYQGTLYSVPGLRHAIEKSALHGAAPRVLILSALYGPLHPLSPIQDYNLMMSERPARVWAQAFPLFLEDWVKRNKTKEVYLFVGTSTAYFRVARSAVMRLLERGLIDKAVQFHVVDGSTRETPLQHGRLLHAHLTGAPPETAGIQVNRLGVNRPPTASGLQCPSLAREKSASVLQLRAASTTPVIANTTVHASASNLLGIGPTNADLQTNPSIVKRRLRPPSPAELEADTKRFHDLLGQLMAMPMQGLPLVELAAFSGLPKRGIYFFLDRPGGSPRERNWRVSRVGTHAVSVGSKSTLRARLKAHLGSRSGIGNHRGSIFRLHVGNAMLRRDGKDLSTWGIGSVTPPALRMSPNLQIAENALERQVSQFIGALGVLWVEVPDEAGPDSERAYIERHSIALLSNRRNPIIDADADWLGRSSTREEIRSSLLWNLKHVDEGYDPAFLDALERAVHLTIVKSG